MGTTVVEGLLLAMKKLGKAELTDSTTTAPTVLPRRIYIAARSSSSFSRLSSYFHYAKDVVTVVSSAEVPPSSDPGTANNTTHTSTTAAFAEALRTSSTIILGTKPADVPTALKNPLVREAMQGPEKLLISIVIGMTATQLRDILLGTAHSTTAADQPIHNVVTALPNVAAKVQQSATFISQESLSEPSALENTAAAAVTAPRLPPMLQHRLIAILEHLGRVYVVTPKDLITASILGAATPAYLAFFCQGLLSGAERADLSGGRIAASTLGPSSPEECTLGHDLGAGFAQEVVAQTLKGTAALMQEGGCSAEEVVRKVMTPGGLTEIGVRALKEGDVTSAAEKAIEDPVKRLKERM